MNYSKNTLLQLKMKKMKTLITTSLIILFAAEYIQGQNKYTFNGTVKDQITGEQLIGAIVNIEELQGVGVASNEYGFFSLTLPEGTYNIKVSVIGYKILKQTIFLNKNVASDLALITDAADLEEVTITGEKKDQNVTQAQMGLEKLEIKEINKIPVLMGEKDVLKTLQLLPGIKSAGEGNAGFYVRGGGADQNLILLDEAPVYNASHLLGFFSTFNSDAIKDLTIYKGSMPAQYGGRLSSVLDIKMNDGSDQKYHVGGGIGIISSKLYVEGPIVKDKGSFLITGRRTYADAFLKLAPDTSLRKNKLFFYDLNAKGSYRINDKNRVFISAYNGRDQLGFGGFKIGWGNTTATLRWNHIVNSRLFSNTSLIYSNYNYKVGVKFGNGDVEFTSTFKDYNLKQEFQFFPNPKNKIRFGLNAIHHTIIPGQLSASEASGLKPSSLQEKYAAENAAFISNEWNASKKINVVYGVRASAFTLLGDGNFYKFNNKGVITDTIHSQQNENVKTYFNIEPRLSLSYLINSTSSFKAAYVRNVQNLHLISNSSFSNPTDLWMPSSFNIKPELADQYSVGFSKNFKDNKYEFSSEVYFKDMQNQIDYKDGANTQANEKIEGELLYGEGRSYGVELLFKKKTGKFTGWIGYTLSRAEKKIDGINNNTWYLAKQDRTHDISLVGIYDISKKWSLSATWVYYTGNAVTFPTGKYIVDGEVNYQYSERNGYRMPSYHRLDVGATWYLKKTKRVESSWNFSVYNAYARENAFMIQFQQNPDDASRTQAIQTTLFKIVPSVTYNFKF
jgi:hypothetical protein